MAFIRSRYDLLLGRPGVEIVEPPSGRIFVHGPRRSGRTACLIRDMFYEAREGARSTFFSLNASRSKDVRFRCEEYGSINSLSFPENNIKFGAYDYRMIRGMDFECMYLDDFGELDLRYVNSGLWESLIPIVARARKVMVASITRMEEMFAPSFWEYRELSL